MTDLVQNGTFETNDGSWSTNGMASGYVNNGIGYSSNSHGEVHPRFTSNYITQSIATTAGQTYNYSFYAIDNADPGAVLTATIGDQTQLVDNTGWTLYSGTFTATSTSTSITFQTSSTAFDGQFRIDNVSVTPVSATCYHRGTRILTDRHEVAIEDLQPGDLVKTARGTFEPIRWIGRRRMESRFLISQAARDKHTPIRIRKGAFAENVPHRDLYVSPCHAMALNGYLIKAGYLVNGSTVSYDRTIRLIEYFHLEFDHHEIIFANGATAESYVDSDNRRAFDNAATYHAPALQGPRRAYANPADEAEMGPKIIQAVADRAQAMRLAEVA